MLNNYLRTALRGMRREKGFAFINVFGLALGLASFLLIMLYVQDEAAYDRQHPDADQLYRITSHVATPGDERHMAITPAIYAPSLHASNPDVEAFLRIHPAMETMVFRRGETRNVEPDVVYADSSFFELIGFSLADGDQARALTEPYSVVLTPQLAARYFGEENPVGRMLRVNERDDYTVTGVLAEEPRQSHLRFSAIMSYNTLASMSGVWAYGAANSFLNSWHMAAGYSYMRLASGASPEDVAGSMTRLVAANTAEGEPQYRIELQAVPEIHLHSDLLYEMAANGNIVYVWVLGIVALFMLGIACINYMNLATARSIERAREVGVRKAFGASRAQLMRQFIVEALVTAGVAGLLAFAMVRLSLPVFNELAGKDFTASMLLEPQPLLIFIAAAALAGLAAGSYPAFVLSRYRPARVLKAMQSRRGSSHWLRQGLVVSQFAAAVVLLVGTVTVYQQVGYIQSKDLGFDKEHILTFQLPDAVRPDRLETIKSRLVEHAGIVSAGSASDLPTRTTARHNTWPEDQPDDEPRMMTFYGVDYDFIETLGFEIAEGRAFSRAYPSDSTDAYLINEAAARRLGWEGTAVGREFSWSRPGTGMQPGRVIGVVKDFHYESFREVIEPAFFALTPCRTEIVAVRLRPDQMQPALAHLEEITAEFFPTHPFAFEFLDERLQEVYSAEERFGQVFGIFTLLTILVACLGLFGLAAFTAEQRTKEIAVRKVLGASVPGILALLTSDFLKLVGFAFFIGLPIAYVGMSRWLEDFAYRIELGPGIFVGAGVITLAIALFTVSIQALRAAWTNPAEAIRNE